ncbi:TPA: hypothetical protein PXF07_000203 [Mannheimia haemolytica]|uniref:Uncharacterized protein n=2 Tax=Mannheimia haemolytica TaxID=75985 RepID=A0A248ZXX4_MANHA|nr:hypothetical protein [Mannheimia haemolytica]AWW70819.1 hypothetical protein C4O86_03020 [Pasteurellaceae bacterium 12565]AGI31904.1 hypothetical protein D650_6340 [Mannheimia haemolytica USDA-ARS-USMARC-183]AGI35991.1 hypothetical protein D648_19880 [Mannheimia haemolytica USDA-ARS-USMARC-185]AGK03262.1 hypothetical protein MHH_c28360 [Mannheimia haemolytica M42548]AGQ25333.1 hypothetical protein F382_04875 [Mannheimia haemolytica D153]
MLNLFKKPIKKSSFEAWAKLMDDVAKVAILAIPVILYGEYSLLMKFTHSITLFAVVYFLLATARLFRETAEEM